MDSEVNDLILETNRLSFNAYNRTFNIFLKMKDSTRKNKNICKNNKEKKITLEEVRKVQMMRFSLFKKNKLRGRKLKNNKKFKFQIRKIK